MARDVFLPWYNTYRFFIVQARRMQLKTGRPFAYRADIHALSDNVMDRWILAALQVLIGFVRQEMEAYRLYTVIPELVRFIDSLSKWCANRRFDLFLLSFCCCVMV